MPTDQTATVIPRFVALLLALAVLIVITYAVLYTAGVVGPSSYNWWGK
jgi:ABC-type transporter Mla maintaining outer membrane lipid asymmetry permease subunit MlaE